ncbi:MAG: amidohydrolase family protein [Myxococcota bacterium]|nr:amidohydrolase family protein [Myxococcota bacterium]
MSEPDLAKLEKIRANLDHPVIDGDGHLVEYLPAVREHIVDLAGPGLAADLETVFNAARLTQDLEIEQRRALGLFRMSWWAFPTANSLDRAAALLPGLMAERLPEIGIDFAVLYPTLGLTVPHIDAPDLRRAACRAFNGYYAEICNPHADRIAPAAVIPMHSPKEAVEELDYAVETLGFRAVVLAGYVARPLLGAGELRAARWIDSFGPDSPLDYDPVWTRCLELGVSPTFHSSAMGWGSRVSQSSYVSNHIGNFATAGEATCRSLFLAGVPRRFPELRFAFLEGGVAWGANLYCDLVGHFEKRGAGAIGQFDPRNLDSKKMQDWIRRYGADSVLRTIDDLEPALRLLSDPEEDPASQDEFRHAGLSGPEDIRSVFADQFFFGCEADDPMNAIAFDEKLNPMGARLRALFSSDIGHWDVPDMQTVLLEAWELVERGQLSERDFRDFSFGNAVRLFGATNPDFFSGTKVEKACRMEMSQALPESDS